MALFLWHWLFVGGFLSFFWFGSRYDIVWPFLLNVAWHVRFLGSDRGQPMPTLCSHPNFSHFLTPQVDLIPVVYDVTVTLTLAMLFVEAMHQKAFSAFHWFALIFGQRHDLYLSIQPWQFYLALGYFPFKAVHIDGLRISFLPIVDPLGQGINEEYGSLYGRGLWFNVGHIDRGHLWLAAWDAWRNGTVNKLTGHLPWWDTVSRWNFGTLGVVEHLIKPLN